MAGVYYLVDNGLPGRVSRMLNLPQIKESLTRQRVAIDRALRAVEDLEREQLGLGKRRADILGYRVEESERRAGGGR